jgi:GDP-L-fucose synthase
MKKEAKIYIAGHRGLVGSALKRQLEAQGYKNIIYRSHDELDLTNQNNVKSFFKAEKPDYVILAAAKVGGIQANNSYPAEFIYKNLAIQTNVIHQSYINDVSRLMFLGSSCIYPKDCPQPMKEEYLLTGSLEPTNRPYALAKIAGIETCWSYNRQYGTQYLSVMPTNLYGPGDNYHLENSHVIPALIRKFHEAKIQNHSSVTIWGTGMPRREFLFSYDMAEACIFLMNIDSTIFKSLLASKRNDGVPPVLNLGTNSDVSIAELAKLISEITGFNGKIIYDKSKPDGANQKLMDSTKLNQFGWKSKTTLVDGLKFAYQDFQETQSTIILNDYEI